MRLLFITNVFPNPLQPTKGVFNHHLAKALAVENEIRVICPVAWTDECAGLVHGRRISGQRCRFVDGVRVHHPRFYFPPKVLREQYGRFMWQSVRSVVNEELNDLKPDAVVGYWAHPDGEVAVRAARQAGVPSIVMVGGSDVLLLTAGSRRRARILDVLRAADAVVPVSRHIRQKLIEFGVPPAKIHVVERGVDTSLFHPGDRQEARRRVGIVTHRRVLLWVGRMVSVKGLDVLVRACRRLADTGRAVDLYLVGDGPLRGSTGSQVQSLGLSELIHFAGVVEHRCLGDWYRAADLTVLSSHSEGVPNVLRESIACGTPYVATEVGGVSELVRNPACRLVPPNDPSSLGEAIWNALSAHRDSITDTQYCSTWKETASRLCRVLEWRLSSGGAHIDCTAPCLT